MGRGACGSNRIVKGMRLRGSRIVIEILIAIAMRLG